MPEISHETLEAVYRALEEADTVKAGGACFRLRKEVESQPEETVRVLRMVEYIGPRSRVEDTVTRSIHGEKRIGDLTIRVATIGDAHCSCDTGDDAVNGDAESPKIGDVFFRVDTLRIVDDCGTNDRGQRIFEVISDLGSNVRFTVTLDELLPDTDEVAAEIIPLQRHRLGRQSRANGGSQR